MLRARFDSIACNGFVVTFATVLLMHAFLSVLTDGCDEYDYVKDYA